MHEPAPGQPDVTLESDFLTPHSPLFCCLSVRHPHRYGKANETRQVLTPKAQAILTGRGGGSRGVSCLCCIGFAAERLTRSSSLLRSPRENSNTRPLSPSEAISAPASGGGRSSRSRSDATGSRNPGMRCGRVSGRWDTPYDAHKQNFVFVAQEQEQARGGLG